MAGMQIWSAIRPTLRVDEERTSVVALGLQEPR